jgi:UTP--glucose-1-phosphate uridylyltransferase
MIKNYFYNDKFYKNLIRIKKDPRIIKEYKKILKYKKMIKFVYQNKPKGTGDAVLKTKKLIKDKYFLMLLPDDLIIKKNCSKSMIKTHIRYNSSVMACTTVNKNTVSRWGIYKLGKKINNKNYLINSLNQFNQINMKNYLKNLISQNRQSNQNLKKDLLQKFMKPQI